VPVVDAHPHLHRDRHRPRGADRGPQDCPQQVALPGQGGTTATTGHLGDRAAEVEVDVVDPPLGDQHGDGLADVVRVHAVQLEAARGLAGTELNHPHRLGITLDQRAGGDHLADEQAAAEVAAEPPERRVGDARHRGEHNRRPHGVRPDRQLVHSTIVSSRAAPGDSDHPVVHRTRQATRRR
jgi:hypothetical protein